MIDLLCLRDIVGLNRGEARRDQTGSNLRIRNHSGFAMENRAVGQRRYRDQLFGSADLAGRDQSGAAGDSDF